MSRPIKYRFGLVLFDRGELYGHLDKNTSSYTCWYFPYTKDWWRLSCRMIIQGTGFILAMMRIKGERKCEGPRRSPHVLGCMRRASGEDGEKYILVYLAGEISPIAPNIYTKQTIINMYSNSSQKVVN